MFNRVVFLTILFCLPGLATANETPAGLTSASADISFGAITTTGPLDSKAVPNTDRLDIFPEQPSEAAAGALVALDPNLSPEVARRAIEAMYCAQDRGMDVDKVIVVDMNIEAAKKRLWAFDIKDPKKPRLVINERVAHGSGSDPNRVGKAQMFSNTQNSHMTSLGLYKISERYQGKNGWSRRLDGLFARFNGKARDRAVVMHPSNYVSAQRVGRSQGCPAVSQTTMDALEKAGLKNAVLWIDGPDKTLAQEVADCAKKRKSYEIAVAAKVREDIAGVMQQRQASVHFPTTGRTPIEQERGATNAEDIGAVPEPEQLDQVLACELTVANSSRLAHQDCLPPIDTSSFGHRII